MHHRNCLNTMFRGNVVHLKWHLTAQNVNRIQQAAVQILLRTFLLSQLTSENLKQETSYSQPPGRGPVPGPGINYTGSREIFLELINNLNVILYLSTCHAVHISVLILSMIMP